MEMPAPAKRALIFYRSAGPEAGDMEQIFAAAERVDGINLAGYATNTVLPWELLPPDERQKIPGPRGTRECVWPAPARPDEQESVVRGSELMAQVLPASTNSLAEAIKAVAPAPPGTIFALGADGGYVVPPRSFTLYFGRAGQDVHVPVGRGDRHVSRVHGKLICDGDSRQWWLSNEGRLPIRLPDTMLLSGHEMPLRPGYTPLLIGAQQNVEHLLQVHIVKGPGVPDPGTGPGEETQPPDIFHLSKRERLVLIALAQRYLRQEPYPQPVTWKQVADDLHRVSPEEEWTRKKAEYVAGTVRERLAAGPDPVPGLLRDEGIGEPVGNTLNHNLIQALLRTATLLPSDLHLLGDGPRNS
jgi:hypothetical protein